MNKIGESKVKLLCPQCRKVYKVNINQLVDWLRTYMHYGLIFEGVWCDECRTVRWD